jgi:hypothetical protein
MAGANAIIFLSLFEKKIVKYFFLLTIQLVKVAIYKYHTNECVYKNEGVGAMAEQSDRGRCYDLNFQRFFPILLSTFFQNLALF